MLILLLNPGKFTKDLLRSLILTARGSFKLEAQSLKAINCPPIKRVMTPCSVVSQRKIAIAKKKLNPAGSTRRVVIRV